MLSAHPPKPPSVRLWDIFCRVIDNLGDAGLALRLGAELVARAQRVRLWIDEPAALAQIGQFAHGVPILPWAQAASTAPGDGVIASLGCALPPQFLAAMAQRQPTALWLNLEHLSAEDFVERNHLLPSPCGTLVQRFFYPGFTARTGGLLRAHDLLARQAGFDRHAWLSAHGAAPREQDFFISLFCYDAGHLPALCRALSAQPVTLLLSADCSSGDDHKRAAAAAALQYTQRAGSGLRCIALPWLPQRDYDELLWACDCNFVRGEDSFTQAHWSLAPALWQIYRQSDGAHWPKLQAWLNLAWPGVPIWQRLHLAWNSDEAGAARILGAPGWEGIWREIFTHWPLLQQRWQLWRENLLRQNDLVSTFMELQY